jgi:hypothetical protein
MLKNSLIHSNASIDRVQSLTLQQCINLVQPPEIAEWLFDAVRGRDDSIVAEKGINLIIVYCVLVCRVIA